jgi:AbrB family looped-hinge helix DNA binding protein
MQVSITYQEGQDMHERLSVVTRKGQITIPAEFRRALGLKEGDKVTLSLEEGEVRLARSESVAARTAGIFKTDEPAKTAEELRVLAEEAIAADVMERSGGK